MQQIHLKAILADLSLRIIHANTVQLNAFNCKKYKELDQFRTAKSYLVQMFAF